MISTKVEVTYIFTFKINIIIKSIYGKARLFIDQRAVSIVRMVAKN